MNHQNSKKVSKNQPKIHRRKNQQINKDFQCPVQTCQKAYGSYAALYTHIKNKHPLIKPPNMPSQSKTKQTMAQPGRPKLKKQEDDKQGSQSEGNTNKYLCKICLKEQCECLQSFNNQEKQKIIQIMGDDKFINFTNQIGQLGDETFTWVRRTQDDFIFKSVADINQQVEQFYKEIDLFKNEVRFLNTQLKVIVRVPQLLKSYLSFSSKFWDKNTINQLYATVYAILAFQNYQVTLDFIKNRKYPHMESCIQANPNEFKRFQTMIRLI